MVNFAYETFSKFVDDFKKSRAEIGPVAAAIKATFKTKISDKI